MITVAESESSIRTTTDIPYLALMGELLDVYCEDFGENWLRYNGTTLYYVNSVHLNSWSGQNKYQFTYSLNVAIHGFDKWSG